MNHKKILIFFCWLKNHENKKYLKKIQNKCSPDRALLVDYSVIVAPNVMIHAWEIQNYEIILKIEEDL